MSKNAILFGVILVIIVGASAWWNLHRSPDPVDGANVALIGEPSPLPTDTSTPHPVATATPEKPIPQKTKADTTPLASETEVTRQAHQAVTHPPSRDEVRKEIAADPHVTPSSVTALAHHIGQQMEGIAKRPADAERLMSDIKVCLDAKDAISSAQALCLSTAQHLGQIFPNLQPRYEELQKSASPAVVKMVNALHRH